MRNWIRSNGWFILGVIAVIFAGLWWTPHIVNETSCLFVRVLPDKAPGSDKLLKCSNIEQTVSILPDGGVQNRPADVQGWSFFANIGSKGKLRVNLRKSFGEYVFYPRLGGKSDSIAIYEVRGINRRLLYMEHGRNDGWTPTARKMLFRADCVANGWSREEFPVEIEIVLEGEHAQLWNKDEAIFF